MQRLKFNQLPINQKKKKIILTKQNSPTYYLRNIQQCNNITKKIIIHHKKFFKVEDVTYMFLYIKTTTKNLLSISAVQKKKLFVSRLQNLSRINSPNPKVDQRVNRVT